MPPRRRPSAQVLSPAGWASLVVIIGVASAVAIAASRLLSMH